MEEQSDGPIRVDNITFDCPCFIYIVGLMENGKTYFVFNGLAKKALDEGFQVHYVVNSGFAIESPLAEQAIKYKKKVFIHPTKTIGEEPMNKLKALLSENEAKKLLIVDNFTYSLTQNFLDFVTYCRKFNTTTVFISHSLFASAKISPRLRENVGFWVFFYNPRKNAYKKILDTDEALAAFHDNIQAQSFRFMVYDPARDKYAIGKLPEYEINLNVRDQTQKGKVAKALKELGNEILDESKTVASTQPEIRPTFSEIRPTFSQVVPKKRGSKKVVDLSEPPAKRICAPPMENVYAIDPFAGQKKKWGI